MRHLLKRFQSRNALQNRKQNMSSSSASSFSSSPPKPGEGSRASYKASTSIPEFHKVLGNSTRILALCGAGLSAASGLDTFRGAGGMWRNHKATTLATPGAFRQDPGLVWLFYSYRRHRALQADPNKAHYALAELSRKNPNFITLTQNVDGLSQRANHPRDQLKLLHGSLFDIKCFSCPAIIPNNFDDPYHPSLAITSDDDNRLEPSKTSSTTATSQNQSTAPTIPVSDLPHCPTCKTGLQRPGVVWFGEALPSETLREVDTWLDEGRVDLILVIGTTAAVYPAAGYVDEARQRGARVAVVNYDDASLGSASDLTKHDFLFVGDAAEILPELLKPIIGEVVLPPEA